MALLNNPNTAIICQWVRDVLADSVDVADLVVAKRVTVNAPVNVDPNDMPWIGVYPSQQAIAIDPQSLGGRWAVTVPIDIYCQVLNLKSGQDALLSLQDVITEVMKAMAASTTSRPERIRAITGYDVSYSSITLEDGAFSPMAIVTVTMEATT